jgi:hypothetical protein
MVNIDWHYLKRPIIIFCAAILIAGALAIAGDQYEKAQLEEYQKSLSTLRTAHSLYKNIINDIDLLDQYRNLYRDYKSSGLVGKERRLSWIESLESTNGVLKLPQLNYSLSPQEEFKRPGLISRRGVEVKSSPMDLSMGMLHEEDLFALLEGLRLSIKSLFTVDSCTLSRRSGVENLLDTKNANLLTKCTIRWVTIDVK